MFEIADIPATQLSKISLGNSTLKLALLDGSSFIYFRWLNGQSTAHQSMGFVWQSITRRKASS